MVIRDNLDEILDMRFNKLMTLKDIGDHFGCTRQRISQIIGNSRVDTKKPIIKKLLSYVNNPDYDYISQKELSALAGCTAWMFSRKIIRSAMAKREDRKTPERLFDNSYIVNRSSGCWEWIGATTAGYARLSGQTGKRHRPNGLSLSIDTIYAHHFSYKRFNGPIEDGKHVLHKCCNSICVNPDHLYLGTHQDNMKDRTKDGNSNGGWKLSYDIAEEIRELKKKGATYRELTALYGVSQTTIYNIVKHITYK